VGEHDYLFSTLIEQVRNNLCNEPRNSSWPL